MTAVRAVDGVASSAARRSSRPRRPPARCSSAQDRARDPRRRVRARSPRRPGSGGAAPSIVREQRGVGGLPVRRRRRELDPVDPGLQLSCSRHRRHSRSRDAPWCASSVSHSIEDCIQFKCQVRRPLDDSPDVCAMMDPIDRRRMSMGQGIPGLRGVDHIGFTVPDLDEAERFLVDVLGAVHVYTLGAKRSDDDWMHDAPRRAPAHRDPRDPLLPARQRQQPRGVPVRRPPTVRPPQPRNSDIGGHHLALYVDDMDAAVAHLRAHDVEIMGEPTASAAVAPRASAGSTSAARGACSSSSSASRTARPTRRTPPVRLWHPAQARRMSSMTHRGRPRRHGAAGARIAAELRDAILAGDYAPGDAHPPGGPRRTPRREPGARCARRCACSRPRASSPSSPTPVPGCRDSASPSATRCTRSASGSSRCCCASTSPLLDEAEHRSTSTDSRTRWRLPADVEEFLDLDREFHLSC